MCNDNKVHLNGIWYKDFLYFKILSLLLLALELKKSQVRSKDSRNAVSIVKKVIRV